MVIKSINKVNCDHFRRKRMKEKIRQICDDFDKRHKFSGTCLVKQGDNVIFSQAYGLAHRGFNIPNRLNKIGRAHV